MPSTPRNRRTRARSLELREAIRTAIYAAEDAGETCPTLSELSVLLTASKDSLRYHLDALVENGALEVREIRRRVYCRPQPSETEASE